MAIEIRPANESDAAGISALIARNLIGIKPEDTRSELVATLLANMTPLTVARRIGRWQVLAAADGIDLAGTAALEADRLRMLFVDPDRHGRGLGSALVARIVEMAKAQNLGSLEAQSSLAAQDFYRHLGFVRIRGVTDRGQVTVLMKLSL